MRVGSQKPSWELSITELADHLRVNIAKGRKISFLIGAGVSRSAGIPTAPEIVEDIDTKYNELVRKCDKRTYQSYMSCISPMMQRELLMGYVEKSRINAAHLYLASMVKKRLADRILTVNFDPLMVNALVYSNLPPYVYDIANLSAFDPQLMATPSVVHLHGQLGALINLHSEEQVSKVKPRVRDVLLDTLGAGPLIVIGYSGENDFVFDVLCEYPSNIREESASFPHGLYWIGYDDGPPPMHVIEGLLKDRSRHAYFLAGQHADLFMGTLSHRLEAESPELFARPFTFLKGVLGKVVADTQEISPAEPAKESCDQVNDAIRIFEECAAVSFLPDTAKRKLQSINRNSCLFYLESRHNQNELDELIEYANKNNLIVSKIYLAAALNNWSVETTDHGRRLKGPSAIKEFRKACEQCEIAIKLKPDLPHVYFNWGNALDEIGLIAEGNGAIEAFQEACIKYNSATDIQPDYPKAFLHWGISLASLGRIAERDEEAIAVFRKACGKFYRAVRLKPKYYHAFYNWAIVLNALARRYTGREAIKTFKMSCEKFKRASKLKPEDADVFINWGYVLLTLGRKYEGDSAIEAFEEAREKYIEANRIKTGIADYDMACVFALEGKKAEALRFLECALKAGKQTAEYVEGDIDFRAFWSEPDFNTLIEKYRRKSAPDSEDELG